jgi:hypothetical protein
MPAKRGRSISNMGFGLFAGPTGGETGFLVKLADITFVLTKREVSFELKQRELTWDLKKREVDFDLKK